MAKFARYLLQKLFVAKSHSLLVVEVAPCKKSLVTRCKIRSLLNAEVALCKTSLVTCRKIRLLLVAEIACCKKSLLTRCKICLLLVAEVTCCKKILVTRYENKLTTGNWCLFKANKDKMNFIYSFFILSWQKTKKDSAHNKINIAKI